VKEILFACIAFAVLMSGCESKEEQERARQAELIKSEQLKKEEAQRQAAQEIPTLSKIGVSTDDGKIVIDTNKAKEFFGKLHQNIDSKSKELDKELKEGNLSITNSIGIEATQEKVSIDLNKTRNFLEGWGKQMESFAREFDKLTKMLNSNDEIKK